MSDITFATLILIIFLIIMNGFFVAAEFAFVRLRPTQLDTFRAQDSLIPRTIVKLVTNLNGTLSSAQLGITLASIALGFIAEPFFHEIFYGFIVWVGIELSETVVHGIAFVAAYSFITYLHVLIGEVLPKSIAVQYAEKMARWTSLPFEGFIILTNPIMRFFVWNSNLLLRWMGIPVAEELHVPDISKGEVRYVVKDASMIGNLDQNEANLIYNVLEFNDISVEQILTPRIAIKALDNKSGLKDIIELSMSTGFSRIPIYEGKMDNLLGFVHVKDVFPYFIEDREDEFDIFEVIKPILIVHEGSKINTLMDEMKNRTIQMAAVVEEFGSLEGIVTMENIIEKIFGAISDEFDYKTIEPSTQVVGNTIVVNGKISLQEFNQKYEDRLGEAFTSHKSVTLAGYILELLDGEFPEEGEIIEDSKFWFKIVEVKGQSIRKIRVSKFNPSLSQYSGIEADKDDEHNGEETVPEIDDTIINNEINQDKS